MASYQVTGVRTEQAYDAKHEHISHVRIGREGVLRRETVVADIRSPAGDRYYTQVGGSTATVVVVKCPSCTFNDYLRTDADSTTSNNLLSLPRV